MLGFAAAAGGALFSPVLGVIGYVLHYDIGPERQWWNADLRMFGLRYSYTLAIMIGIGIALNFRSLRWGKALLVGQEKLMLAFLAIVWGVSLITESPVYTQVDPPWIKMTKLLVFVLMMTHVVTTVRYMNWLFWALVVGSLILGLEAYTAGRGAFAVGRLELVGGPDFQDSNALAAYLAAMLPIIGIQFLRSPWYGKLLCLAAGVFTANAIILTRSRGAVVGLAVGAAMAVVLAPRKYRAKIGLGLVAVAIGGTFLADVGFWERASTINSPEQEMDASARSRFEIWEGGIQMAKDHPLGVGPGNFGRHIGNYLPQYAGRDAHNTYVRCLCEVGWVGLAVFAALIVNAAICMWRVMRRSQDLPDKDRDHVAYLSYALLVSLVIFAACGVWGSLVYTESLWWLLAMPVCMMRVTENIEEDAGAAFPMLRERSADRFNWRRARKPRKRAWTPVQ